MRRDYFTLDVLHVGDENGDGQLPALVVDFEGPVEDLTDRLHGGDGPLDARAIDVAFRLLSDLDDDADGALSVTNRLTGEYIVELNAPADDIVEFVRAANARTDDGDGDRYRLVVRADGDELAAYEKSTFLVYDDEGGLLRKHSLIPGGVEL